MSQRAGPLSRRRFLQLAGTAVVSLAGCFSVRPPNGGAIAPIPRRRRIDASDIGAPPGYCVQPIASGLTYPTGVILDDADRVHIVEGGYSYGEDFRDVRRGEALHRPVMIRSSAEAQGQVVYMRHCYRCHQGGEGGLAPALNVPLPARLIRTQVRRGLGAMPAFSAEQISDGELEDLVAYLRAVRRS